MGCSESKLDDSVAGIQTDPRISELERIRSTPGPLASEPVDAVVGSNEVVLNLHPISPEQCRLESSGSDAVGLTHGPISRPATDDMIRSAFQEADVDEDGVLCLQEVVTAVRLATGIAASQARLEGLLNCTTASRESFHILCTRLGSNEHQKMPEELEEAWSLVKTLREAARAVASADESVTVLTPAEQGDAPALTAADELQMSADLPKPSAKPSAKTSVTVLTPAQQGNSSALVVTDELQPSVELSKSKSFEPKSSAHPPPRQQGLQRANTMAHISGSAVGRTVDNKFAATKFASFASVETFFAGLEGLIGTPSSDFMTAMGTEHKSTEPFTAFNANKMRETTPDKEWKYVTQSCVNLDEAEPSIFAGRDQLPKRELSCGFDPVTPEYAVDLLSC
jgi:hypothetical protein